MFYRFSTVALWLTLMACAQTPTESTVVVNQPKPHCVAPPPVRDIWALAPLLKQQGKINDNMSRDEQEAAIREDIRQTNERFLKCNK